MTFSVRIVSFVQMLPIGKALDEIGRQLLKAGTSVGANYRAACVARSKREFSSKLQIAFEEADECVFWLELLRCSGFHTGREHDSLLQEALELTKIFAASLRTSRSST